MRYSHHRLKLMLTTPVISFTAYASYFHNPSENEAFIRTLSPKEKQIYALGYIQAAHQIQENVTDSKRIILNNMLDETQSYVQQSKDKACLRLLDSLDASLSTRIEKLQAYFFKPS